MTEQGDEHDGTTPAGEPADQQRPGARRDAAAAAAAREDHAQAAPVGEDEPRDDAATLAGKLAGLMQDAAADDLDERALAAAEAALAEGRRALELARSQMRGATAPAEARQQPAGAAATDVRKARARPTRELVLRVLLAINLLAMVTIALLPPPPRSASSGDARTGPVVAPTPPPAADPVVRAPDLDDPVIRAFAAADRRDYRTAIRLLQKHLDASPRLDPAKKANVLLALEHYSAQLGDIPAAQEYQRKTEALRSSHSLPEDLVKMALEAERNGDVESMRRHYARLLLQQRQIPSALYRHVAEAYLKLGDSYRQEAESAEEAARQEQLQQLRERLRQQDGAVTGERGR